MIAQLFSAIKSVFGSSPNGPTADEIERFRARSRMRSRQQRLPRGATYPPRDGTIESDADLDADVDDDAHRRRKVPRSMDKALLLPQTPPQPSALAKLTTYTASTYQSYVAPPAVFDDGPYPDSPVVHEHQVLMMSALAFSESLEDLDGADSVGRGEHQSLWRRRFSSGAAHSRSHAPRLSPKLRADALWASHGTSSGSPSAGSKLWTGGAAADHVLACCGLTEARGQLYD